MVENDKRHPRITVISPMYNVADYVGECIESLQKQDFRDFEAVFVDDGSPDDCLARARQQAGDDPRFRFLQQENAGLSASRNNALEVARGDYVVFLDSDDAYVPNAIGDIVRKCDENDADAVFFNAKMLYDSHDLVRTNFESYADRIGPNGVVDGYEMLVFQSNNGSFRSSACMYAVRRELLDENGLRFYPGIIHEDQLFTLKLFPYLKRCVFLQKDLYVRRMRHGSLMTNSRGMKNVHGLFVVTRELERFMYEHAAQWPDAFIDAFTHELQVTWTILADDAKNIEASKLEQFRAGLDKRDRAFFDLHVLEAGSATKGIEDRYEKSTTYRVGRAIMRIPIWLKERLQRAPE